MCVVIPAPCVESSLSKPEVPDASSRDAESGDEAGASFEPDLMEEPTVPSEFVLSYVSQSDVTMAAVSRDQSVSVGLDSVESPKFVAVVDTGVVS